MKFTGERLIPDMPILTNMIVEELGRLNFAKHYFQSVPALDFGCGTGYAANFMSKHGAATVIGIDISSEAISFAQKRYSCDKLFYVKMNCLDVALASGTFGFICSLDVIEHFEEKDTNRFLSEIVRLLLPGGWCLITTPNKLYSSPNSKTPSWKFHRREFFYNEFLTVLQNHFDTVEIYGGRVPVYEDRLFRRITNSPLSFLKHFLPAKIRVGFSSGLRYFLKAQLTIEDVVISKENVEKSRAFLALCQK